MHRFGSSRDAHNHFDAWRHRRIPDGGSARPAGLLRWKRSGCAQYRV